MRRTLSKISQGAEVNPPFRGSGLTLADLRNGGPESIPVELTYSDHIQHSDKWWLARDVSGDGHTPTIKRQDPMPSLWHLCSRMAICPTPHFFFVSVAALPTRHSFCVPMKLMAYFLAASTWPANNIAGSNDVLGASKQVCSCPLESS